MAGLISARIVPAHISHSHHRSHFPPLVVPSLSRSLYKIPIGMTGQFRPLKLVAASAQAQDTTAHSVFNNSQPTKGSIWLTYPVEIVKIHRVQFYGYNLDCTHLFLCLYMLTCLFVEVLEVWKNADAICFDVDSTVCLDEGIDEFADFCGAGKAVAEWTAKLHLLILFM